MSQYVPATFQSKFNNNVEMALQQKKPMLLDAVMVTDDASADMIKVRDIFGNALPQETTERHGDTKYANTTHDGIWLGKPNELYYAEILDNADKLATSLDLEGEYVQAGSATVNRAIDQRILEGIYGTRQTGTKGTVVSPFPTGMIVPVATGGAAGAQRMNVAKLRAANKLLAQNFVDTSEKKFMILSAEQSDDLLSEIPATSADFKASFGGAVDEDSGFLTRLLGFNFIPMELANPFLNTIPALAIDGSGYRKNPFWVKSGVVANFWQRLRTSIDPLPQKVLSRQIFAGTTLAATRTQDGKVGVILNSEA